jgi:hypothetical protein
MLTGLCVEASRDILVQKEVSCFRKLDFYIFGMTFVAKRQQKSRSPEISFSRSYND